MLDLGRFHADQMARFANKLDYCDPKIDLTEIQKILTLTGMYICMKSNFQQTSLNISLQKRKCLYDSYVFL